MYGASYAEAYNMPALANEYFYSFVYQSLYIIPDIIIVIVVGILLFTSKNFTKQVEKYTLMGSKKAEHVEPAKEEQ